MIFKQLFKPKWQHDDPNVRMEALKKLEDQDILQQLASRDAAPDVRKTALEKLASFDAWAKALSEEQDSRLQKLAFEKVKLALLAKENELPVVDKKAFLENCKNTNLLEDFVRVSQEQSLRLLCLTKLHKNHLYYDLAVRDSDEKIALFCVEKIEDKKQLEKIVQKTPHPSVKALAQQSLDKIKELEEKPVFIRKSTRLILSKLLALKDKDDYQRVQTESTELQQEWSALEQDFILLDDEERQVLTDKYQQISQKLNLALAELEAAYNEEQAKLAAQKKQQEIINSVEQGIAQIQEQVSLAIESEGDAQLSAIQQAIADNKALLQEDHLGGEKTEALFNRLNEIEVNAAHIPEFAEQVSKITRAITQLSQYQLPKSIEQLDDAQNQFDQWMKDWKQNKRAMLFDLPSSLQESADSLIKTWNLKLKEINAQQNSTVKQVRGQLRELERLIRAGRFNVAFGLFRKIGEGYESLSENYQQKVDREYQRLNEQIAELEDWKAYIGLPRKRELLAEIQQLAEQNVEDAFARAKQIKLARHTWRLLGNVSSEENTALNEAFDVAAEQAFAPCREKFAELEAQRAENLVARQKLCEQAAELEGQFNQQQNYQQLSKSLTSLQNEWNKAGSVERAEYVAISDRFFSIIKPLRQVLNAFYASNAESKRALIEKAEQIAQQGATAETVDALKALQQQWKETGYAGASKENKLWSKFRAVNDKVFAARQAEYEQNKQQQQAAVEQLKSELDGLFAQVNEAQETATIKQIQEQVKALDFNIGTPAQNKKLEKQSNGILQTIEKKLTAINNAKNDAVKEAFFTQIESLIHGQEISLSTENKLTASWQQALEAAQQASDKDSQQRRDLTIQIEILCGVDTPAQDTQRRMEIQVQMLSDKLNAGETKDPMDMLLLWLACGSLDTDDGELFNRVKKALSQ
ncbi:DUF349 domain-containing protein [Catenovulum sediminis]|uniref:DUF349 domain-containing protein n=1 Tax=Catenovulum sediminis TaxID=1740262 RepID=UPI00117E6EC5|nr:DUF349 domain-containing protein [Catenovulum sediminis]